MKKRVFTALLAAVMISGLVGCGNQKAKETEEKLESKETSQEEVISSVEEKIEEKEPVTIDYWYRNNVGEQQYTKDVEKILNEMLKEMEGYEHISIDLHPCKDFATEFTLAQADGSEIDLVATYGLDFTTLVNNGDFIPLDELMEAYPSVISELPEWMVPFGKVYDEQYFIPAYQQAVTRNFMIFPDKYLDMYYTATGKNEEEIRKTFLSQDIDSILDFYEEYLLAVRTASGLESKWIEASYLYSINNWFNAGQLVSLSSSLYEAEGREPMFWQASEEYKQVMQRMNEWYKKGYIHPDYATMDIKPFTGDNMLSDASFVVNGYRSAVSEEYAANAIAPNLKATAIWLSDHDYVISKYAAGGNAIYADCQHPEEAMMIIELLMTKKGEEFYNTFVWGIEGTHWEWVDQATKRIKTLEYDGSQGGTTSTYHAWKWNVGNTFNAWNNQAVADDYNDSILAMHNDPSTVSSDVIGITWDLAAVSDQISQCNAVVKEYHHQALVMADDFEAVYNEFMSKLNTAGVEDIIKVILQQYEDYLTAK